MGHIFSKGHSPSAGRNQDIHRRLDGIMLGLEQMKELEYISCRRTDEIVDSTRPQLEASRNLPKKYPSMTYFLLSRQRVDLNQRSRWYASQLLAVYPLDHVDLPKKRVVFCKLESEKRDSVYNFFHFFKLRNVKNFLQRYQNEKNCIPFSNK